MGQVTLSLPSDGTTIDASDVNTPFNTLVNEFNGNIDDNNVKTGANISGAKLNDASIPGKKFDSTTYGGWIAGVLPAVSSVTANGNRSYDVVFASTVASYLTPGMRLRTTRTVAAPTQCTSLNGTTQYYSKASPNKLTFTDDFVVSAWVKLSSYLGTDMMIVSRYNATSGFRFLIQSTGQVFLGGSNGGAGNYCYVNSYQSIPLNKWVHVAAQLDMSGYPTVGATNSYVMIDGVDVPTSMTRAGTNPTALIQAGNLEIGSSNGGATPFPGKIAQVAIYNAKVTQAVIKASMNQTLTGSETSLASAYSFNGIKTDLNTSTPNDLTANGSAVETNADSPYSIDANGVTGSYDFATVRSVTTTTAVVQTCESNTIPTSGGVSAVDLSSSNSPFGMPDPGSVIGYSQTSSNFTTTSTSFTAISGLATTVYVPPNKKVRVTISLPDVQQNASAGNYWNAGLDYDGSIIQSSYRNQETNSYNLPFVLSFIHSPSSGSHTYTAKMATNVGSTTVTVVAGVGGSTLPSTGPATIVAELI